MGVSDGGKSSSGEMAAVSELEAELALLREENARLKVERHRPADAGHVIERMRALRQEAPSAQDGDESSRPLAGGAQALADCLVLREGLMDACQEAQQAMRGIGARLESLTGDLHGRASERAKPERLASAVEVSDVETDGSDEDSSELVQSVA